MTNLAIIGLGKIGKELYKKSLEKGYSIPIIVEQNGIYNDFNLENKIDEPENYLKQFNSHGIEIACLTIPTLDRGETARDIILSCAKNGIPLVTSEKGALGNYYPELKGNIAMIGYRATVGGGSRMIPFIEEQLDDIVEAHFIFNGTVNHYYEGLSRGMNPEYLTAEEIRLGYVKPGATTRYGIINNELCGDVPKKTAIINNLGGLGPIIRASEIKAKPLSEKDFEKINARFYRFIVSFYKGEGPEKNNEFQVFLHKPKSGSGGRTISAGFKYIPDMHYCHPLPEGVNNAAYICKGKNPEQLYVVSLFGPGAGPDPTTDSMGKDIEQFEFLMKSASS